MLAPGHALLTLSKLFNMSKHGLAKLKCQEGNCEEEFTRQLTLDSHIKQIHNKEKPHQCEHLACGAKFAREQDLLAHYRSEHGLDKLKCQDGNCDKEFVIQSNLDPHNKQVHNKEKPHQCEHLTCGAKFASKDQLQGHYMSKHGQAKLKCQEGNCGAEFTRQSNLDAHIKTIHRREKLKKTGK